MNFQDKWAIKQQRQWQNSFENNHFESCGNIPSQIHQWLKKGEKKKPVWVKKNKYSNIQW